MTVNRYQCPFCKADLTMVHAIIARMRKDKAIEVSLTLCDACGESIVAMQAGFRKPTFREMDDLRQQDAYQQAKAVWMAQKEQKHDFHITRQWDSFIQTVGSMAKGNSRVLLMLETAFFVGAFVSKEAIKALLSDSDLDDNATEARLLLTENELRERLVVLLAQATGLGLPEDLFDELKKGMQS
jgi:hypothetical protein